MTEVYESKDVDDNPVIILDNGIDSQKIVFANNDGAEDWLYKYIKDRSLNDDQIVLFGYMNDAPIIVTALNLDYIQNNFESGKYCNGRLDRLISSKLKRNAKASLMCSFYESDSQNSNIIEYLYYLVILWDVNLKNLEEKDMFVLFHELGHIYNDRKMERFDGKRPSFLDEKEQESSKNEHDADKFGLWIVENMYDDIGDKRFFEIIENGHAKEIDNLLEQGIYRE